MALTTLLGSAQLAIQDALSARLSTVDAQPIVPNFLIVSLRRESFLAQYPGALASERDRLRRELTEGVQSFLSSHGWRVAGTGRPIINVLIRSISNECDVQARTVDALYELEISDNRGIRTVNVRQSPAIIGRAHDSSPRGFVPVHDDSRLWSREHLQLIYADLHLLLRCMGRNQTTLNDDTLGDAEVELHTGDVVRCGNCQVTVKRVE